MKRLTSLILLVVMVFSLTSCKLIDPTGEMREGFSEAKEAFKEVKTFLDDTNLIGNAKDLIKEWGDIEAAQAMMKNYKITMTGSGSGIEGDAGFVTEIRAEDGYAYIMDNAILYVDYSTGKAYALDSETKTGAEMVLETEEENLMVQAFGQVPALMATNKYGFGMLRLLAKIDEASSMIISGHATTAYIVNVEGIESRFWVDREYGITMKSITYQEGIETVIEVTELKIGGVKLSAEINLKNYTIEKAVPISSS